MTISHKLKTFLDDQHVHYEVTNHPAAYTAQEIAGAQHVPGSKILKAVIVRTEDDTHIMCVLSSSYLVDFKKLQKVTNKKHLELVKEEELKMLFPEDELGAEPPLNDLADMPLLTDSSIASEDFVYFNGGNHTDMVKMRTKDYLDLSKTKVFDIGRHI